MPVRRIGYGGGVAIDDAAVSTESVWSSAKTNSEVQSRAPATHQHDWSEVQNKPSTFPPAAHQHDWAEIQNKPSTFPPAAHTHSEYVQKNTDEVAIGNGATAAAYSQGVAIGKGAQATGTFGIAIGEHGYGASQATQQEAIAIGGRATAMNAVQVGKGPFNDANQIGMVRIGPLVLRYDPNASASLQPVTVGFPGELNIYYSAGKLKFRIIADDFSVKEGEITVV